MPTLARLFRQNFGLVAVSVSLTVFVSLVGFVQPLLLRAMISALERHEPAVPALALLIASFVISSVANAVAGYCAGKLEARVTKDLRSRVFGRFFSDQYCFIEKDETVGASLVMNDTKLLASGLANITSMGTGSLLTFSGGLIGALYFFPMSVVAAGALSVLAVAGTAWVGKRLRDMRLSIQEETAVAMKSVTNLVRASRQIKRYNVSGFFAAKGEERFDALYGETISMQATQARLMPLIEIATKATFIAGIGVAAVEVGVRGSDFGAFLAFVVYFQALTGSIQEMLSCYVTVQEAQAGRDRLEGAFRRSEPKTSLSSKDTKFSVAGRNLRFSYDGVHPILSRCTVVVGTSGVTAIVGSSGCGKTTLIKVLAGDLVPDEGEVMYGASFLCREKIALVEQAPLTVDGSWKDNIVFGRSGFTDSQLFNALVRAGFMIEESEVTEWLSRRISEASGGELQRIMLARALIGDPTALILDEPTSNVDPGTEARIGDTIKLIGKSIPVIVVAHRPHMVAQADTVLVLENGRIKYEGKPQDFQRLALPISSLEKRGESAG